MHAARQRRPARRLTAGRASRPPLRARRPPRRAPGRARWRATARPWRQRRHHHHHHHQQQQQHQLPMCLRRPAPAPLQLPPRRTAGCASARPRARRPARAAPSNACRPTSRPRAASRTAQTRPASRTRSRGAARLRGACRGGADGGAVVARRHDGRGRGAARAAGCRHDAYAARRPSLLLLLLPTAARATPISLYSLSSTI